MYEELNSEKNSSSDKSNNQRLQTRAFEHDHEDHVLALTIASVRSHPIRSVGRALQVNGGRNDEHTGRGSILEMENTSNDSGANQPEDHCVGRLV
jgi:hypothetical protein